MKRINGLVIASAGLALCVGGLAEYVHSCSGETYDSVHYNDAQPDFGAVPSPVVITSWEEKPSRPVPGSEGWEGEPYDEAKEKAAADRVAKLREDLAAAYKAGDYATAEKALTSLVTENVDDKELLRDQLEVMRLAPKEHVPQASILAYMEARRDTKSDANLRVVADDPKSGFLQAFALYGIAALKYDGGKYDEAAKIYEAVAATFKDSPRKETALIMAVRTRLRGVRQTDGKWKIAPENLEAGKRDIAMLRADYPSSRFLDNAYDWETRTLFLDGKYSEAFLRYLRQYGRAKDYDGRVSALASLEELKDTLKGAEADKVRAGLLSEPELLQPYLEYRLYHGEDRKKGLDGLVTLAKAVLDKKPSTGLSAGILARLAEISYLKGDYPTAEDWADQSLKTESGDLATYVLASAQFKQKDVDKAADNYRKLIHDFEGSYLVGASRENLALIYEGRADWGKALDEYRALQYRFDVATLVDVRMSVEDLQQYIASHQSDPELPKFKFALGLRYLRKENLDEAERWFKDISDEDRKKIGEVGSQDYSWFGNDDKKGPRDTMADPMDTIRDLRGLKEKFAAATTPNDKAAAQYALASYWYERRNLLLYNAAFWGGARSVLAGFWDAGIDKQGYAKAIEDHHYEHECLWKARKICVLLAKDYPNSPVVPKALYRAACASRRLADFNPYWREKLAKPLWNESIALMERVAKEHPNDPLAKNAAKYAKAFKEERDGTSRQEMFALGR